MTEAIIAIVSGLFGALLFYVLERKIKPPDPKPPTRPTKPPLEVDYVQSLEEITNEEPPPPVNTDHLSDAAWWRRHSAGDDDNG